MIISKRGLVVKNPKFSVKSEDDLRFVLGSSLIYCKYSFAKQKL